MPNTPSHTTDARPTTTLSSLLLAPSAVAVLAPNSMPEWSHSRQHLYDTCHRALYYSTELAREGWRRDASDDARLARRLKSLTSLALVVGSALHERAAEIATAIKAGGPLPTLVQLRERTRHELNHVWVSSRDRHVEWMRQPTRVPMLQEHYYGRVPSPEQLARTKDHVERGLVALRGLGLWAEIGALEPDDIARIDKLGSYTLPGVEGDAGGESCGATRVWAAPDLVVRRGEDGQIVVIDYKSGPAARGAALARHIAQVASYAVQLRCTGVLGENEGCRGLLVYLRDGTEVPFEITPQEIDAAAARIRAGALAMALARSTADHAAMDAVADARAAGASKAELPVIVERARRESPGYAMTPDRTKCRDCPFREVCDQHQRAGARPVELAA